MITTYQIRNVLRIYGNQLKKRSITIQDNLGASKKTADVVDISSEARQKQTASPVLESDMSKVAVNGSENNEAAGLKNSNEEGNMP